MIKPKGFGKKYFTLSSIQAHSCATKLHSQFVSVSIFFTKANKDKELNDEDDPPTWYSELFSFLNLHGFFIKCTQKSSRVVKKLFCKLYNLLHYGFCRSGIHPPTDSHFQTFSKKQITLHTRIVK